MLDTPDTFNAWTLFTRSLKVSVGTLGNSLGFFFLFAVLPFGLWVGWITALGEGVSETVAGVSCLVFCAVFGILSPLILGGIAYGAFQYLRGTKAGLGECLRATFPRCLALLVGLVLITLAVGFGTLACIVPGLILWVGLYLTFPIVVVERASPIDALSRSWELTRGYRLSLFVFLLLLELTSIALAVPMSLAGQTQSDALAVLATLLFLPGLLALSLLATVSYGVAYFDLRHLQEGDLEEDLVEVFE